MSLLPFGALAPYQPRTFVPDGIDLSVWDNIAPLFDELEKRMGAAATPAALEAVLLAWGELGSALQEESTRRFVAMCCHTDDAEAEKDYLHVIGTIEPLLKPRGFALEKRFIGHPQRPHLPSPRYDVLVRNLTASVALYREKNVELETEDQKAGQQYQKLSGSLTVEFQDEERTLDAMARFQEETDRSLRQDAWELTARRRLTEKEKFDDLFDEQVKLRTQIARNAGYENYRDYAFPMRGRFDYTTEDCVKFHDAVAEEVVPALKALQARRREQLGVDTLRPWDLAVDPTSLPALRPFQDERDLLGRTQRIFEHIDGELAAGFQKLQDLKLLDLVNRKGKAPGGYQASLPEARLPFIFMNAVGLQRDVEVLLHEAGHAFHALAARSEPLAGYRVAPIEFCEVASMSMELLGNDFLEEFHAPAEADRARRKHLENILSGLIWIATVDAFQHWIYTHPDHTRDERATEWKRLMGRFGANVDWSGYEEIQGNLWHRQLHLFLYPFYYIEYGIAQLGALQVWANSKQDKAKALQDYKAALALGGSKPLPELFAAAGCRFQFDAATIRPLVTLVNTELEKLAI